MRDKRNAVTEDVFNQVRNYQVVKNYPIEAIRRETGLSPASIRNIRRLKTWPNYLERKQAIRNRYHGVKPILPEKQVAEPIPAYDPAYVRSKDFDEAMKVVKGDQAMHTKQMHQVSRAIEADKKDLAAHVNRVSNAVFTKAGKNRITQLEKQVEDLKAFQETVKSSRTLSWLLKRAVKRVEGAK